MADTIFRLLLLVVFLWLFLYGINAMGASFKALGSGFASGLMQATRNPLVSLMLGVFVTSVVQSSSTTTSLIVTLVGSGTMTVEGAVPMIMGANIGTTVTNTIVSLGSVTRGPEFRRTFSAAIVHDTFNLMAVVILLPLELAFGVLSKPAHYLAVILHGTQVDKPHSPIYAHFKGAVKATQEWLAGNFGADAGKYILLVGSVLILFASLALIVRTMKGVILSRTEVLFDRLIGKSALIAMAFGAVMTAMVQSSSITTSLLVPLAGTGIISLRQLFPITLGCNIGTTITALLASTSVGGLGGLSIALVHVIFNIAGITIIYPFKPLRELCLRITEAVAAVAAKRRILAVAYVLTLFFVLPGLALAIQKLLGD